MRTYKITQQDLEFLEQYVSDPVIKRILSDTRDKGVHKAKGIYDTGHYELALRGSDREKLLDALGSLFVSVGLMSDGEPNALGIKIEDLTDLISGAE